MRFPDPSEQAACPLAPWMLQGQHLADPGRCPGNRQRGQLEDAEREARSWDCGSCVTQEMSGNASARSQGRPCPHGCPHLRLAAPQPHRGSAHPPGPPSLMLKDRGPRRPPTADEPKAKRKLRADSPFHCAPSVGPHPPTALLTASSPQPLPCTAYWPQAAQSGHPIMATLV